VLPTTLNQEDSVSVGFNATLEYQYETNFLPSLPKGPADDYLPPWTRPDKVVRDQFSSTHDAQLVMEIVRWDLTRTADGIKIEHPLVDDEVLSRSNYVNVGGKYTQADSHRGRHAYIGCALTLVPKSGDNGGMQVKFDMGPVSYTPPAPSSKSW